MSNLKIINQEELKDWAKEIFQKNSFNMVDVSSKKETFRRALASGKIYVGKEVFDLIKNKTTLDKAYNDKNGYTAKFSLNLINIINYFHLSLVDWLSFQFYYLYLKG